MRKFSSFSLHTVSSKVAGFLRLTETVSGAETLGFLLAEAFFGGFWAG